MRLLVLLMMMVACNKKDDPGSSTPDTDTDPGGIAVTLDESGVRTCANPGLRFAQHYDQETAAEQPIPAAYLSGGGLAIEDFDGDGHLDVFLPSEQTLQFRFGDGLGDFAVEDTTALAGIDLSMAVGATAVDVDADGDLDLFVTRWMLPNKLLRNDGGRRFTDVTTSSGLGNTSWRSQSASWADIDLDGDLDLFVGSYGEWATILDGLCDDHLPDPAELYRNEGDGTFTDVSHLLPVEVHDGYSFMSGWYDLDDDGYPELVSAHDDAGCGPSVLVDNEGGETFTVNTTAGVSRASGHDMGMAVGDLNGDELPDFLFTSYQAAHYLYSSRMGLDGSYWTAPAVDPFQLKFGPGTAGQAYGWGAEFGDIDNDADLDAVMVFGYWSAYTGDADPVEQFDGLWIQDAAGGFSNQAPAPEWRVNDPGISRGVVLADLNEDGWLDMVKRQLDGPTLSYLSRCGAESWLQVKLRAPAPNTHAIGAKVRVVTAEGTQVRWITSGSTGLYTGSPLSAHFGLGWVDQIEKLEVVWPDMQVSVFEAVDARQVLTVTRTGP